MCPHSKPQALPPSVEEQPQEQEPVTENVEQQEPVDMEGEQVENREDEQQEQDQGSVPMEDHSNGNSEQPELQPYYPPQHQPAPPEPYGNEHNYPPQPPAHHGYEGHPPTRHPHDGDSGELSTTRLFVRPFPPDVQESELNEIFSPFGPMKEVKILNGFAFVEFEEPEAASRAIEEVNGKSFANQPLEVVFSKLPAKRYRVTLRNLPEGCSWQELKDLAREHQLETTFSSVNTRDFDGTGALEFPNEDILN